MTRQDLQAKLPIVASNKLSVARLNEKILRHSGRLVNRTFGRKLCWKLAIAIPIVQISSSHQVITALNDDQILHDSCRKVRAKPPAG